MQVFKIIYLSTSLHHWAWSESHPLGIAVLVFIDDNIFIDSQVVSFQENRSQRYI